MASKAVLRDKPNRPVMNGAMIDKRRRLDNRLISLRSARMSYWVHWRVIADYLLPRRYKWLIIPNQGNRGSPENQRIVDNTGTLALGTCTAGMMAGITSPGRPWFRLQLSDAKLNKQQDVKVWLDSCTDAVLSLMAQTNFYTAVNQVYEDLIAFGTAVMLIYEDWKSVFNCYNPCAGEYYLANSYRNEANTMFREFTMTVDAIVGRWGIDRVDGTVATLYNSAAAQRDQEFIICHAIEENPDFIPGSVGPRGMPFKETYWQWGSTDKLILEERYFHEQPFMAPRWGLLGNEAYGRSPGMDALGDLKQLQVQTKRLAQAIDKMVNPPMVADVALKNEPASLLPGGVTYVASTSNVGFKPAYEVNPDVTKMETNMQQCRDRIKQTFFADLFLMISNLDTVRTATEVAARKEEKLIQLGPVLERFEKEFLDPAIKRVFNIMQRASIAQWRVGKDGLLPRPPDSLKGVVLQAEYVSMLAEAQKAVTTTAVERWLAQVGSMAGIDPTVYDNVAKDEVVDGYGEMLGVPQRFIVDPKKVTKVRAQRAKDQQQQQQMQATLPSVKAAQLLSQTDVGGGQNALQKMIGSSQ